MASNRPAVRKPASVSKRPCNSLTAEPFVTIYCSKILLTFSVLSKSSKLLMVNWNQHKLEIHWQESKDNNKPRRHHKLCKQQSCTNKLGLEQHGCMNKHWSQTSRVHVPAQSSITRETFKNLRKLPVPRFPQIQNEVINYTNCVEL